MREDIRVIVKCPLCDWRILDKITPTSGDIQIKCPNCRRVVNINLSLRSVVKYRISAIRYKVG